MDVEELFHMTGGIGETSYARNSSFQKKASDMVKHIILETLRQVYVTLTPRSLGIADLGCSSGPNTLSIIKDIIETVEELLPLSDHQRIEFRVYLNDLPTNDFNSVFKSLPNFHRELKRETSHGSGRSPCIFVAGYPGSFYGRLFPNDSLHFVYSSYSLHWLSKVPPALFNGLYNEDRKSVNKGNVYIGETSPPTVSQAYFAQFQEDYSVFLRSRSEEVVTGGRMVFILLGRIGPNHVDRGNFLFWNLLSRSLAILVSQGEVEEEALDAYDVNFYAPTREEIEEEIRREGSFEVEKLEMFQIENETTNNYGTEVAMTVRAIQGPMIAHHFGERILDSLFHIYAKLVDVEFAKDEISPITFALVLRKL